jgi:pimeloyl-ACP methyl ester carboxylesterase
MGDRNDVTLVAQSLAGFTAPLIGARTQLRMIVLVNAMIPKPDETAGAWWAATGAIGAREDEAVRRGYSTQFNLHTYFFHDVPEDVLRSGPERANDEAETIFAEPCRFTRWPNIPIQVLGGRDDRFFPIDFQRRVALDRLGKEIAIIPGGHLLALSKPEELATRLIAFEGA